MIVNNKLQRLWKVGWIRERMVMGDGGFISALSLALSSHFPLPLSEHRNQTDNAKIL
jgi:hypothetical protein